MHTYTHTYVHTTTNTTQSIPRNKNSNTVNICIYSAKTSHLTNGTINKQKMTAYIQTTTIVKDDTDDAANVRRNAHVIHSKQQSLFKSFGILKQNTS